MMVAPSRRALPSGYAIFRDYLFQGPLPACYDETGLPVVFPTETEAQREIADARLTRLQELLHGERDFESAITSDEFVLPVTSLSDGSIATEDGRPFGRID